MRFGGPVRVLAAAALALGACAGSDTVGAAASADAASAGCQAGSHRICACGGQPEVRACPAEGRLAGCTCLDRTFCQTCASPGDCGGTLGCWGGRCVEAPDATACLGDPCDGVPCAGGALLACVAGRCEVASGSPGIDAAGGDAPRPGDATAPRILSPACAHLLGVPAETDAADAWLFGALLPLTGPLPEIGEGLRAAVGLAVAELNAAGGLLGRPVAVLVCDTAGDPAAGTDAAAHLAALGVGGVVGPALSSVSRDVAAALAERDVLLVSPSATAPGLGDGLPRLWRLAPSDALQGEALGRAARAVGWSRAVLMTEMSGWGSGLADALELGLCGDTGCDPAAVQRVEFDSGDPSAAVPAGAHAVGSVGPDVVAILAVNPAASGLVSSRHHGDLHLGQVLLANNDFLIIDFEGEPSRSMEQRRARHTPLRDVASMLRSFDYARWTALRGVLQGPDDAARFAPLGAHWLAETREAFLAGYARTGADTGLFPSLDAVRGLLRLLELEKAMYELRYEIRNRPGWVGIPLQGILDSIRTE